MNNTSTQTSKQAESESLKLLLNSPVVVFHGTPSQALDAELKGSVSLACPDSLSIKAVKVYFEGIRRISIHPDASSATEILQKKVFYRKELELPLSKKSAKKRLQKLSSGAYTWPFRFSLERDLPETVEGLSENSISYRVVALVQKCYLAKNVRVSQPIRVIRTLGQDTLDTIPLEQISQEIWNNKVSYQLMIPQVDHLFGTSISTFFELTPLLKGITLGKVKMELYESVSLRASYANIDSYQSKESFCRVSETVRLVAKSETDTPVMSEQLFTESEAEALQQDECVKFNLTTQLPKSLKLARQSADSKWIRVKHTMKVTINIKNPDGHISQIIWKTPIRLYLSPEFPVTDDLAVQTGHHANNGPVSIRSNPVPPPRYGDHRSDPMVDSVAAVSRRGSEESVDIHQITDSSSGSESTSNRVSLLVDGSSSEGTSHSTAQNSSEHMPFANEQLDTYTLPPHLRMVQQLLDRLSLFSHINSARYQSSTDGGSSHNASNSPSEGSSISATVHDLTPNNSHRPMLHNNITFTLSPPSDRPHSFHELFDMDQDVNLANGVARSNSTTGIPSYAAATMVQEKPPTYEFATSRTPSPTGSPNPRRILAAGKTFLRRSLLLEVQQAC